MGTTPDNPKRQPGAGLTQCPDTLLKPAQAATPAEPGASVSAQSPSGSPLPHAARNTLGAMRMKTALPLWRKKEERAAPAAAASASKPIASRRTRVPPRAAQHAGAARQKIMTVLVPVLAVTLLVLLRNPLKPRAATAAADVKSVPAAASVSPASEIDWQTPPEYQPGGRDPMRLAAPATPAEETAAVPARTHVVFLVTGILFSADKPAAIVDTQVVHEGQTIGGATLVTIARDSVTFTMNGQTWKQTVSQ